MWYKTIEGIHSFIPEYLFILLQLTTNNKLRYITKYGTYANSMR